MNPSFPIVLHWQDWLNLFQHFATLSLLSIGGAVATLPEVYRFMVGQHHWITATQFNNSVAIAKIAPGPNCLFIVLVAWNIGLNSGSTLAGLASVCIAMTGMVLPSSVLMYFVSSWLHRNREVIAVQAFTQGLAPIVVALLIATGWIMASSHSVEEWRLWIVSAITVLLMWHTRIHMLWLMGAGALLGGLGWI